VTYLGNLEQTLSQVDNILHLTNTLNTVLDSLCVLGAGLVQYASDTVDVTFCPVNIRLPHSLHKFPLSTSSFLPHENARTYLSDVGEENE
jgi:hypothetical protein